MIKVIGIGEMAMSNNSDDKLKTFALGSCVGITAYSPSRKVGGLIHIALPSPSRIEDMDKRYCYYATTGIPFFFKQLSREYGCLKNELIVRIFGGADSIRKNDAFNVGKKNLEVTRQILGEMKLGIHYSETGSNVSRTIEMDVANGDINIWHHNIII